MKILFSFLFMIMTVISCRENAKPENTKDDPKGFREPVSNVSQGDTLYDEEYPNVKIEDPKIISDGEYSQFYKSGKIKAKGFYKDGQRDGHWIVFFESGNPWSEANYKEGKKEGHAVVYYSNGKKRYEGDYKNDERTGKWKFYDVNGVLVKEE
jgi:antitoxin component YwqK of YwqJK toxin-antitoxin module